MKKIKFLLITTAVIILAIACFASCDMFSSPRDNCERGDHVWEERGRRDSTCYEIGFSEQRCYYCGKSNRVEIPMLDHDMEEVVGVPPTCYDPGYASYSCCKVCGYCPTEQQYIPELQHRNSHIENKVDPTCEKNGYTGDTVCDDCGLILSEGSTIYTDGHECVLVEGYAATCTEDGLTNGYFCTVCETMVEEQFVIEAAHNVQPLWHREPTCTEKGSTEGSWCPDCETYFVVPEEIPMVPHNEYISTQGHNPGCDYDGCTDEISCSRCNNILVESEPIPASHKEEIIPEIKATCSTYGYSEGKKCTACGETLVEPQRTAKLPHTNIKTLDGFAATCYTSGLTDGKACADCGAPTVTQHTIPALGHIFGEDGNCSGCDLVVTDCLEFDGYYSFGIIQYYYVTGFVEGMGDDVSVLVIPNTYNDKPVHYIAENAFANRTNIKKVILPENLSSIDASAFSGCNIEVLEVKDSTQYNTLVNNQNWMSECSISEVHIITNNGKTPYEIYLEAMNSINHNLTRYHMVTNGVTYMIYGGVSYKAISTNMVNKQYDNNYYVYQSSTDHMSSPNKTTVSSYYYVNNYLYIPNVNGVNCKTYCSFEAFSDMFLIESSDIPALTAKYFKDARFVINADGTMSLMLEMDDELIADLILYVTGVSADMNVTSCVYNYTFDINGNIISYTSVMEYSLNGYDYSFKAESTTKFENATSITAPSGYTDISSTLSNQCRYGHKVVTCEAVPATCFGYGKSEYSYCSTCYAAIENLYPISPSHNYDNGECTECGHFEDEDISHGLAYWLNEDGTGYVLVGLGDCKDKTIYVPQQIYGLPVLSVAPNAFDPSVTSTIVIGKKFWSINSFPGCEDTTQYWPE